MQYKGNPVSKGIAIGDVYLYKPVTPEIIEKTISADTVEDAVKQYYDLRDKAQAELISIKNELESSGEPDKAKIFAAQETMLLDVTMNAGIEELIRDDLLSPECAVLKIYSKFARLLLRSKDEQIRERAADLKDLETRLYRICFGVNVQDLTSLEDDVIIVAHELLPSDTARMDRSKVLAIVTETGGDTSHTAIIARSYEIPALLGIADIMEKITDGETVIVDAVNGVLYTSPDDLMLKKYEKEREEYKKYSREVKKYLGAEPVTIDGTRIEVYLNLGSAEPAELAGSLYTDGAGLFRTEFMYMSGSTLPTEEEQFQAYRKAAIEFGERPVILRTLDIGGDKHLDCLKLPEEDNPFLGQRALRLCFEKPSVFKTQIRAILRAAKYGNLWMMFPMVGSLDDIRRAKAFVAEVENDLDREGIGYNPDVPLGIMIEIPAIAVIADIIVNEVDFASIGTNDLCQYITAVDRLNPKVSEYYQSYHPAMFRLIGLVAEVFNAAGKPISVCGEMGGEAKAAAVFIGLGIRKLSMSLSSVPEIKKLITGLTLTKAKTLVNGLVDCTTADDVELYIKEELKDLL